MTQLAKSIRDNIGIARARLLESYDEAKIGRACLARIDGLRSSFPRKLKDLGTLSAACGLSLDDIVVLEALSSSKVPSECTGFLSAGSASKGGMTINAKVRDLDAPYIQGIAAYPSAALHRLAKREERFPANSLREAYSFVGCATLGKWGVGMGMNEFGVSVGDHTSYAKDPLHPETGLESNDVCRLVLEGSRAAENGARLIKDLVEGHGHAREGQIYFVADAREGWIIEATSERCAAVRVLDAVGVRANGYRIGSRWDMGSDDLAAYARESGLWGGKGEFEFARSYSKPFRWAADRRFRYRRAMELLSRGMGCGVMGRARNGIAAARDGAISLDQGLAVLSDHAAEIGRGSEREVVLREAISGVDVRRDPRLKTVRQICSHFRYPSVSAMIAVHDPRVPPQLGCVAWICLGNPCLSLFVPIPSGTARTPAGFSNGGVWRKFAQIERAARGRYRRVKAIAGRVLKTAQDDLRSGQSPGAEEARALREAGRTGAAGAVLQKSAGSAFRKVDSAADVVLRRLEETGL